MATITIPAETKVIMRLYLERGYGIAEEYHLSIEPDTEHNRYFFEFSTVDGVKHRIPKHLIRHITFIDYKPDN